MARTTYTQTTLDQGHLVYLHSSKEKVNQTFFASEAQYQFFIEKGDLPPSFDGSHYSFHFLLDDKKNEEIRNIGFTVWNTLKETENVNIIINGTENDSIHFLEGFILSSYQFDDYKSKEVSPKNIQISTCLSSTQFEELSLLCLSVFEARDLVNQPQNKLHVLELVNFCSNLATELGVSFKHFTIDDLIQQKFGGILCVNQGSTTDPALIELRYTANNPVNKKPYVLVGKGVVYDTGGLSLKPTEGSMDFMKCDMAGAASVIGAFAAIVRNELPIDVILLVPTTDNRPGLDAVAPGDVVTMYDGTTVEVLNTDAEGRLILADALAYAQSHQPELVIDVATLTGAALRTFGHQVIAGMGNHEQYLSQIVQSGHASHERVATLPLWDDYKEMIESDIADLKNIGGALAGTITAGKFLEHFVDYHWLHLDIAGPAYIKGENSYRGKNATGAGVRLLYHFMKSLVE